MIKSFFDIKVDNDLRCGCRVIRVDDVKHITYIEKQLSI